MRVSLAGRPGLVIRLVAAVAVMAGFSLAGVSPASAAPQVTGSVTVIAPPDFERGGAGEAVSVTFQATESATFRVDLTAPYVLGPAGTCGATVTANPGMGAVPCTYDPVTRVVTVGDNGNPQVEQPANVTLDTTVSAPSSIPLTSTEGNAVMSASIPVEFTATGTGSTTGTRSGADPAIVTPNPLDAVFAATTSVGSPSVPRSPTATNTYTVALDRTGSNDAEAVNVTVQLVADSASGTSVTSTNPVVVSFAALQKTGSATFTVAVPASATAGTATYHAVVTYDPQPLDGVAVIDTEMGSTVGFAITIPSPSITLSLASTVADDSTVTRGQAVEFTVTATNTAAAGSADATDVTVVLPVSTQVTIGATSATSGAPVVDTASNPQTVTVNLGTLAAGSTATLTVPVTVKTGAAKTAGALNDVVVGPATATFTFTPPAGGSGSASSAAGGFTYEIRPDADVSLVISAPASVTLDPDEAEIAVDYTVTNAGPDPAAGVVLTANPPSGLAPGAGSVNVTNEGGGDCVTNNGTKVVTCTFAGAVGAGDSRLVEITWTIRGAGSRSIAGSVATSTNDTNPANNTPTASSVTVLNPSATITATATPNKTTAIVAGGTSPIGDTVVVEYELDNTGANNVKVTLRIDEPACGRPEPDGNPLTCGTTLTALSGPGCPAPGTYPVTCDVDRINKNQKTKVTATYSVSAVALPGPITFSATLAAKPGSDVTFVPMTPSTSVNLALPAIALTVGDEGNQILNVPVGSPSATFTTAFEVDNTTPGTAAPGVRMKFGLPAGVSLSGAGCSTDGAPDNVTFPTAVTTASCAVNPDPVPGGTRGSTNPVTFTVTTANAVTVDYTATADLTLRRLVPAPSMDSFQMDINFLPVTFADLGPIVPGPGELRYEVLGNGDNDGGDGNGTGGNPPLTIKNLAASFEGGTATVNLTAVNSASEVQAAITSVSPTVAGEDVLVTVAFDVDDGSGTRASTLTFALRSAINHSALPSFGYDRPADGAPPKSLGADVDPSIFEDRPTSIGVLVGDLKKRVTTTRGTYSAADITGYALPASGAVSNLVLTDVGEQGGSDTQRFDGETIIYTAPPGYTTDPVLQALDAGDPQVGRVPPPDGFTYRAEAPEFSVQGSVVIAIPNGTPIGIDNNERVPNGTTVSSRPTVNDADPNTICRPQASGAPAGAPPCQDPDPFVTVGSTEYVFDDENRAGVEDADGDQRFLPLRICGIGNVPPTPTTTPVCPADDPAAAAALGLVGPDTVIERAAGAGKVTAELRATKKGADDPFDPADASKIIDLKADNVATGALAIAYVVADVRGGLSWGQVNVTVPNTKPAVSGDVQTVFKNTPKVVVDARGIQDTNEDNVQIQSVVQPAHGRVTISSDNKQITYTPALNYLGEDSFSYTVSDGRTDGSADATVRINVVENPSTLVAAAGGGSRRPAGTLPATGADPLALLFAGGVAVALGALMTVMAGRRHEPGVQPLHRRA